MAENVIVLLIMFLCSFVFVLIGLWAQGCSHPVHFWSGTTVSADKIWDVKAYNKENSRMWITYGVLWAISALLCFINVVLTLIMMVLLCFPGLVVLILVYRHIYAKYERKA